MFFKTFIKKFNFSLIIILVLPLITSCVKTKRGYFGIGRPVALNPNASEKSLNDQRDIINEKSKVTDIDPFSVNQLHYRSSNNSQSGKLAGSFEPSGMAPSTKDIEPKELQSANPIVTMTMPTNIHGLAIDKFTSVESFSAQKVDKLEDFEIENIYKGKECNIYKLKFDIWIEPEHQNYWTYTWRWFPAIFMYHGFRIYTKDYHAKIDFTLPLQQSGVETLCSSGGTEPEVLLVQPVNEGTNTQEMLMLQQTSQLAGGGTWQGVAAVIDLAERNREQFVEQRKNPLLRGVIDSRNKFHFVISPRQYVNQRTFRIPFFMSRYSLERGIESGPYPVSAYVLASKKEDYLNINVCGSYKKFGDPYKNGEKDRINFRNTEEGCKVIKFKMPRNQAIIPKEPAVSVSENKPNRIDLSWGNRKINVISSNTACNTSSARKANVKLFSLEGTHNAILRQGEYKNETIFWIETKPANSAINGKKFVIEFCSNGVKKKSKPIKYIAENKYQSGVSVGKKDIKESTQGSEVKISILGTPGEKLSITDKNIKYGNEVATISRGDENGNDHILEFSVIVPKFKNKGVVSITATINKKARSGWKKVPITIEQSFIIG